MLIKPYIGKARVNSLPSESKHLNSSFLWWEEIERKEFLESEGRLLILEILNKERNVKANKKIHDEVNVFNCSNTWPICQCQFSRLIRGYDIGFSFETIDRLGELI